MTYPAITLETYPPMVYDGVENPFYDEELLEFTIPYAWLSEYFYQNNLGDIDEDEYGTDECDLTYWLTNVYTWDDTLEIYNDASADGVIISEKIVERRI